MTGKSPISPQVADRDYVPRSIVDVDRLTKSYGRRLVLDQVCFTVRRGRIVGLVGENGAGKSTLMRCLVGLEKYGGRVEVNGRLGYCPQQPILAELLTIREQLLLFAAGYGMTAQGAADRIESAAERLGFTDALDRRIDRLSGGTRQKVNLTGALLHDPDILVLDEPYQGFDYETYEQFWDLASDLRDQGRTVVVVTHLINDLDRLDTMFRLRGGCLTEVDHADGSSRPFTMAGSPEPNRRVDHG